MREHPANVEELRGLLTDICVQSAVTVSTFHQNEDGVHLLECFVCMKAVGGEGFVIDYAAQEKASKSQPWVFRVVFNKKPCWN